MKKLTATKLSVATALIALSACSAPDAETSSLRDAESEKLAWIEKTAQALRNGEGLGDTDDVEGLLALPKTQVVEKLMQDPRFGDTVLAFNLFYLGRGVNNLKKPDMTGGFQGKFTYDQMVYAMPQALASARAVMDGGDYFSIYGAKPALYVAPMKPGIDRAPFLAFIMKGFDDTLAAFGADPAALNKQAACQKYQSFYYQVQYQMQQAGFDTRVGQLVTELWLQPVYNYPSGECYDQNAPAAPLKDKFVAMQNGIKALFTAAETLPSGTGVKHLGELAKIDIEIPGLPALSRPLTTQGFWSILRNSSTNFNRKRSAYMLRTYFCDDLTPLAVEASTTEHNGNAHATDPACQACHYKLDPMGGLFRYNGQNGTDYENAKNYTYDDFKQIGEADFATYLKSWKDEQSGKWLAGYYVGAKKAHSKWQGDKLQDFWTFLPKATEARQCLVRRMAEYFLGPDQVYDGGWLEEIASDLKPGATSAESMKQVVTALVTSKTFSHQNPEPGQCYDFSSEQDPNAQDRAPCEIAHVVKKRCANCHSDATEFGVDFSKWVKLADDQYGFEHLDADGNKLTRAASFKMIIDRLTTSDPAKRMPKGGSMPEMERQTLYKWLEKNGGGN